MSDSKNPTALITEISEFKLNTGWAVIGTAILNFEHYALLIDRYYEISPVKVVPRKLADAILRLVGESAYMYRATLSKLQWEYLVIDTRVITFSTQEFGPNDISGRYFDAVTDTLRWKTLGNLFALVASAIMLLPALHPLSKTSVDPLQCPAYDMLRASSTCITLWREQDAASDIAALAIYQNLIATSLWFRKTDSQTWKRMSDLAGIIFEAEVDQNAVDNNTAPAYLVKMHRCLFATAYSVDKSI
ncbi:hypothetical protein M426DRAFT_26263 [Hypoxylon sp. CI-4A]|nr:hypothetical protein M426DRAFT_26263 [Hypoxylon sp. CI-4A]